MVAGKKLDSKFVTIFARIGDNPCPKIGIALSGKVFKRAVDRSRAKRLASGAFEPLYEKLSANINIVALPKASILSVKSGDVLLELEQTLLDEKIIH